MTAPTTPASHRAAGRKGKESAKKSFWSMEIGKKSPADERVEHPAYVPILPRVDLLPQAVRDSVALHNIIRWFVVLLALVVVAGGAVWYLQGSRISDAEASLAQAQTEKTAIDKKMADLAPIKQMYIQIKGQQELVNTTLAAQPKATEILEHLYTVARESSGRNGIEFSSASVAYHGIPKAGDPTNLCADPNPFVAKVTVGCMTFEGSAASREQISNFLTAMAADPMFVGPYVDNSTITAGETGTPGRVTFTGTAGISPEALKQPLTPEQIEKILRPPAAQDGEEGSS